MNETDLAFYREAVFLLKTYFFVYLGISIHFSDVFLAVTASSMVLMVYVMRLGLARVVFRNDSYSLRDTSIASMMAPKGLAAAVLATLPLEYGVVGGEVIRDATYMVVLVSITLTALLVMVYPSRFAQRLYALLLGKPVPSRTVES